MLVVPFTKSSCFPLEVLSIHLPLLSDKKGVFSPLPSDVDDFLLTAALEIILPP